MFVQYVEFDLRHVEPTAVFGCVVNLQAIQNPSGFGWLFGFQFRLLAFVPLRGHLTGQSLLEHLLDGHVFWLAGRIVPFVLIFCRVESLDGRPVAVTASMP